jgi:hypothetical protein
MRLSSTQIELLRRSAQNPGRPGADMATDAGQPAQTNPAEIPDEIKQALGWAAERGDEPSAVPAPAPEFAGSDANEPALDDGWQPIPTAPVLRNVEVRAEDILGRFALLYPCRLVPERGWINAILGTPLNLQPVEWRPWLQKFPGPQ